MKDFGRLLWAALGGLLLWGQAAGGREMEGDSLSNLHREAGGVGKWVIVPATLVTYGVVTQMSASLRQWDRTIDGRLIKRDFHWGADNYLQYAPVTAAFWLGVCGVEARNDVIDRLFITSSACLMSMAVVHSTKYFVSVGRPDGGKDNSFPSGHTAVAFVGAHILYKEYKGWLGLAGYTVATATGAMRMLNRRHWLSDVLAGAGTGILCVEASYLLLPVFQRMVGGEEEKPLAVAPVAVRGSLGVGLTYTF